MPNRPDRTWSVVVPTRDRPEQLGRCLDSLVELRSAAGEPELIIVDDDPGRGAELQVFTHPDKPRFTYLNAGGNGPATARNMGARAASGDLLAFTDDDCEPEPGWLEAMEEALRGNEGAAAAGATLNGAPEACSEVSQLVVSALQRSERALGGPAFVASNNVAFPRQMFLDLAGFDESFPLAAAEDRDLCERWIRAGHRFIDVPGARILHRHHLDLRRFWRQHYRYGQGAHTYHRLRMRREEAAGPSPQPNFYRSLVAEVKESGSGIPVPKLAALAGVSQIANIAGYARAALAARGG